MEANDWFKVGTTENLISPSLLVYPERITYNIRQMMAMVADVALLRPHVKTHKTTEIIHMQQDFGIKKFKCATIAEAEMLALCGVEDILLAMPVVGANIGRLAQLMATYPNSHFSALVDNPNTLAEIVAFAQSNATLFSLWMDINTGMDRTGIAPGPSAVDLYLQIEKSPFIKARGLHAYDGHIRHTNLGQRSTACNNAFDPVLALKKEIQDQGATVGTIVAGGSPTFPIHAKRVDVETAPGTTLLWDAKYGALFPDMLFQPAAVIFTRIISKPATNLLCFDLGHKSIAPEMDFPRVQFLDLPNSEQISQSEEHLVVKVNDGDKYSVGDGFYALPMHICPTVAKYESLQVVKNRQVTAQWKVTARNQKLTI